MRETLVHTETIPVTTETKGVKGFWNKVKTPFKYQSKRHGFIASEFQHDSAVAEDIATLKNFSREYSVMSRTVDALVDAEKNYSINLLRNGHRIVEGTHQFHTSRAANHLKAWSELQLQLAQLHSNFVSNNLTELGWFLKNFNRNNIKNAKLVKHQANIAAMNRDEYIRGYTSKAEKESKNYFGDKHDDLGLRLAEERKIMSQHQYEAAARQLESSIVDLFEFEAREVVAQIKLNIEAQRQYYQNALSILNTASQTIETLPIQSITMPLERRGSLMAATAPVLPTATATAAPVMVNQPAVVPQTVETIVNQPQPAHILPPAVGTTSGLPISDSTGVPSSVPSGTVFASTSSTLTPDQKIQQLTSDLGGSAISPAKFVHNA
jgi:hypothetical protein